MSERLVWTFYCVSAFAFWAWDPRYSNTVNASFFFFCLFSRVSGVIGYCASLFSLKCWLFHGEQCIRALFTDPQIPLFSNFFIRNGFHSTIHTFKKYFATVFLVSVFSFSKNKLNPNRPKGLLNFMLGCDSCQVLCLVYWLWSGQLFVVFLTVRGWALARWSPTCDSP